MILGQCSNRLKTWRRSHGNRLQIRCQRRDGVPGWQEDGNAHSDPHSKFATSAATPHPRPVASNLQPSSTMGVAAPAIDHVE